MVFVNRVFGLMGLSIIRRSTHSKLRQTYDELYPQIQYQSADLNQRYRQVIQEFEGCFRELVFHDLPACEGRTDLLTRLLGTQISEAIYVLRYLHKTLALPGDICEFGIAQGATSALLANELRETDKTLWLFDSFEGLPNPTEKDVLIDDIFNLGSMAKYQGTMACGLDEVIGRLNSISYPLSKVKIVSGFIEETILKPGLPEKVSFAYVDFDFYTPISIALEFLDKHLVEGGCIIVDDYGFFSAGAKTAVDEFHALHEADYLLTPAPSFGGHFAVLERVKRT